MLLTPTSLSVLSMPARTEHTCTYKYMLIHTFTSSDATDTHLSQCAQHVSLALAHHCCGVLEMLLVFLHVLHCLGRKCVCVNVCECVFECVDVCV